MTDHESADLGEVTIFRRIGNCTRILRKLKCLLYAETKLDYIKMPNAPFHLRRCITTVINEALLHEHEAFRENRRVAIR